MMFVTGNMCVSTVQVVEKIGGRRDVFCILKQTGNILSQRKDR